MLKNVIINIQIIYLSNILTMSLLNIYYESKIEYTTYLFFYLLIDILDLPFKNIRNGEILLGILLQDLTNILLLVHYNEKDDKELIDYAVLQYIPHILLLIRKAVNIKVIKDIIKIIIWHIYPIYTIIIPYYVLINNYRDMNNGYMNNGYLDNHIVFFLTMTFYLNINWTLVKYKIANMVVNLSLLVLILFNYFIVNDEIYYTNNILLLVTHMVNLDLNNRYTKTLSTIILQKIILTILFYDISDIHSNNELIIIISTLFGIIKYNNIHKGYDILFNTVLFCVSSLSIEKKVIGLIIIALSYHVSYIMNNRTLFDITFFFNLIILCRNSQNKIEL